MACCLYFSKSQHSWQPVSQLSLLRSKVSGSGRPSHPLGPMTHNQPCGLGSSLSWPGLPPLSFTEVVCCCHGEEVPAETQNLPQTPTSQPPAYECPEPLLLFLKAWIKWPCTQTSQAPLRRGQASSRAGLRGNIVRRGPDQGPWRSDVEVTV